MVPTEPSIGLLAELIDEEALSTSFFLLKELRWQSMKNDCRKFQKDTWESFNQTNKTCYLYYKLTITWKEEMLGMALTDVYIYREVYPR